MAVLGFFLSAFLPEQQPQGGAFSSLERKKRKPKLFFLNEFHVGFGPVTWQKGKAQILKWQFWSLLILFSLSMWTLLFGGFFFCQPLGLETVRLWCLNVQNWMWKAVAGKSESNEIIKRLAWEYWSCVGQGGCRLLPCEIRLRTATTLPVMLRLLWWICARAWKWK